MPEPAIETAIARGLLKPEETTQAWSVIQGVYAAQLSDRAPNWLTDNAVITTEQRTNAAAILRSISERLERRQQDETVRFLAYVTPLHSQRRLTSA